MSTKENLKAGFAGESQANRKYLAFSKQAQKEGLDKISRLFQAIAEAETINALKHFELMGGIGNSLDNVQSALEGEVYEFTHMYPGFIDQAEKEDEKSSRIAFHLANEAEKAHAKLFEKAVQALQGNNDFPAEAFALCPICGYVAENQAPERCPICGAKGEVFKSY